MRPKLVYLAPAVAVLALAMAGWTASADDGGKSLLRSTIAPPLSAASKKRFKSVSFIWDLRRSRSKPVGVSGEQTGSIHATGLRQTSTRRHENSRIALRNGNGRIEQPGLDLRRGEAHAQPAGTGLRGAVELAGIANPGLRASIHEAKAAKWQAWRQLARFTPVITAGYDESRAENDSSASWTSPSGKSRYASLTLSLPIFTGGQRYFDTKSAQAAARAAKYDARATRDDVMLQTIEAYVRASQAAREIRVRQAGITRLEKLRRAVRARINVGFASAADLALVSADISAARRGAASARSSLDTATAQLTRLAGRPVRVGDTFPSLDHYLGTGKETLLASAHRRNPRLRSAAENYHAARYASRSAFGRHLPQVSLTGEYRHYLERPQTSAADDGWTVGVRVRVPLLDLATAADTGSRHERKEAALYREADALHRVRLQIDGLWAEYQAAVSSVLASREEHAARRKAARSARSKYKQGFERLETLIDRESDADLAAITVQQIEARRDVLTCQLLLTAGLFTPEMLDL